MIPWHPQPVLHLYGPLSLHAFGALVAAAILVGTHLAVRRCEAERLDPVACEELVLWAVGAGFLGAHLYDLLAYYPEKVVRDPLSLLRVWENISSFGGMAGGIAGTVLYFRFRRRGMAASEAMRYVDAIAWAFPFAWLFGRLGCTVAHDHPGSVTTFPLGFSLSTLKAREYLVSFYREAGRLSDLPPPEILSRMGYHDLGFYEFLYTLFVLAPASYLLGRRSAPPGARVADFILLYAPVRFLLDFLRIADVRYGGLTPGQWAAAVLAAAALVFRLAVAGGRGSASPGNGGRAGGGAASAG
jgi:phosphatidylglycerol:prolipoprotein diacylglycerol transferase